MSQPRALITGITGQDGSYLAELLLEKGYQVFGMTRRASTENVERIAHLADRVTLLQGDLLDAPSLDAALREARPAEVYNLAAQSFVPTPGISRSSRRNSPLSVSPASSRRSGRSIRRSASTRRPRRRCSAASARCRRRS